MTDCPAYLSLTLNDRTAGEELSRYDALVSCPPRFNLTIHVPPAAPHTSRFSDQQRLFEVVLDDSKVQQRVFLSTYVVPDAAADRRRFDASPAGRNDDDDDDGTIKYAGIIYIFIYYLCHVNVMNGRDYVFIEFFSACLSACVCAAAPA